MKAWQVGPYNEDWVFIVHAETRGKARKMAAPYADWEFTNVRATRLPSLDDRIITRDRLIEAGFPERVAGKSIEVQDYLIECRCDICEKSLNAIRITH